jgi:hypothetical protein
MQENNDTGKRSGRRFSCPGPGGFFGRPVSKENADLPSDTSENKILNVSLPPRLTKRYKHTYSQVRLDGRMSTPE